MHFKPNFQHKFGLRLYTCTANYIRNRCTFRSLNNETPYFHWAGNIPNLSNLIVFGSKVMILDKRPNKGKFQTRSQKAILLGFSDECKGFRVWNVTIKRVDIVRDIKVINESERLKIDIVLDNNNSVSDKNGDICKLKMENEQIKVTNNELKEGTSYTKTDNTRDDVILIANLNTVRVSRGRPKIICTGNPSRPRKLKSYVNATPDLQNSDSENDVFVDVDSETANIAEISVEAALSSPYAHE